MEMRDGDELCFPQLLNTSCRKPKLHWSRAVLLNTVLSCISLTIVLLNLLVIISVSHFRQLHTSTNFLLLSLAVSDFLVGLVLMPVEILRSSSCWFFGDLTCTLFFFTVTHILCASIGNIVLISVDRYVAICHPLQYPVRVTTGKIKQAVFLCWALAGVFSGFFVKDDLVQPGRSNSCLGECELVVDSVTGTVDLVLNFVISISVIVALYLRVFVAVVSQVRAARARVVAVALPVKAKAKRSELKAARALGVVVLVYLMCFCPYYCYSLVGVQVTSSSLALMMFGLFFFNSCLNPIIYAMFYSWFRKSVKIIITLQILQPKSSRANVL